VTFDPSSISAITFDCYGTLIDWQHGITAALTPLFPAVAPADIIRAFGEIEREVESGPWLAYRAVCADVVRRMSERCKVTLRPGQERVLAMSIKDWPAFPDTPAALRLLKSRYRLCIVSNIDRDIFVQGTLPRLGVEFDQIITTDDVRAYKPNHAHFHEAARRLGLPFDRILHVAESRFHDIEPANALGIRTVLVDRQRAGKTGAGSASGRGAGKPDCTVRTLAELADTLCA
jgi:2-haloacid dehalogenase